MKLFFQRDILSKLTDRQYLLISLIEAPLLAFILGFFTRYIRGPEDHPDKYLFINNENLPAYLFMSVVVSLFLGLIGSSEEIIKDRKILQRESFLNLSRFSYLNSKILIMFILSAIQTISYVLIGNLILGIKGMTLSYWMVLFSASCFANMLGLNISSGFDSVITIYILIPFLLIPQLLLGGVIVKFDKLHRSLTSYEYVPVIGDVMTLRWAYEALAVEQFKNNRFEKNYFPFDQKVSNLEYNVLLVNELKNILGETELAVNARNNQVTADKNLQILDEFIRRFELAVPAVKNEMGESLHSNTFDHSKALEIRKYLDRLTSYYNQKKNDALFERDHEISEQMTQMGGEEAFVMFKNNHYNTSLAELVTNKRDFNKKVMRYKDKLICKFEPVYMEPTSRYGRAHFYAPVKFLGNQTFDTLSFNVFAIWLMSVLLYITLYFDVIRKTITFFETIRLRKTTAE